MPDTSQITPFTASCGGGLVLKSQSAVSTSSTSITSTTFVSFGLSDTITCASTNSKVLMVLVIRKLG